MSLDKEPSLDQIDDYNDNESPQKRRTIYLVILLILIVGAIYTGFKYAYSDVEEYIGTEQNPGINTTKGY